MEYKLCHYGIRGQHWGIRRYQNKDGSLTPEGVARMRKIESNERLQRKETRRARRMLSKYSDVYRDRAIKTMRSAYRAGSKRSFDIKMAKAHTLKLISRQADKYLSDIDSGTVKAGRDYMVYSGILNKRIITKG